MKKLSLEEVTVQVDERVYEETFRCNDEYVQEEVKMILSNYYGEVKTIDFVYDDYSNYIVFVNDKRIEFDY